MFLGFLVLITALSISAVAIYYSVAGLVAIFAAAAIPIMIMGSVLEIGKLVTAVWLHRYWQEATWWLKSYLTVAVVVLMFITSMGIFGFLSKAHIEQTAQAEQSVQEIVQIEEQILREQNVIERTNLAIESLRTQGSSRDQEIQEQIDLEQQRINTAYERIEPALEEQRQIVEQRQQLREQRISEIEAEIQPARQGLDNLNTALANNDISQAQAIAGTRVDGTLGPGTERAIAEYRQQQQSVIDPLQERLEQIRTEVDTLEQAARDEIARLRQFAEQQIQDSNTLIARLRSQIGTENTDTVQEQVQQQQSVIDQANLTVDSLIERKFELETAYRILEAEVGPVKYLAEFVYGDTANEDLLEEAVRWVIVVIIFVFDPLAVLLLIASQQTFEIHKKTRTSKKEESIVEEIHEEPIVEEIHEEPIVEEIHEEVQETVPVEFVNPVSVANAYKSKKKVSLESTEELSPQPTNEVELPSPPVLSLEEQRKLEYQKKEQSEEFNNDKEAWKHDHPDQTLKMYKTLYINGKIDKLPWEQYRQNSEQSTNSLFSKLQQRTQRDDD